MSEAKTKGRSEGTRSVETGIEIQAPIEAVWKAISDGEELSRWFPMEARVKPGAGGSIWMSWGPEWAAESRIAIWEPNRHLRLVTEQQEPRPQPTDAEKASWASAPDEASAARPTLEIAVDYRLETSGGTTTLRLVHSGFGAGAAWDNEYDEVRRGWLHELRSLRHYLERHRGTSRRAIWVRRRFTGTVREAWSRLMGRDGLDRDGSLGAPKEGAAYRIATAAGDAIQGHVLLHDPPHGFAGTWEALDGAIVRALAMDYYGQREASLWLAAYRRGDAEIDAIEQRWTRLLATLFP